MLAELTLAQVLRWFRFLHEERELANGSTPAKGMTATTPEGMEAMFRTMAAMGVGKIGPA